MRRLLITGLACFMLAGPALADPPWGGNQRHEARVEGRDWRSERLGDWREARRDDHRNRRAGRREDWRDGRGDAWRRGHGEWEQRDVRWARLCAAFTGELR